MYSLHRVRYDEGRKSVLYAAFTPRQEAVHFGSSKCAAIDCGYPLHKDVWSKPIKSAFELVCQN